MKIKIGYALFVWFLLTSCSTTTENNIKNSSKENFSIKNPTNIYFYKKNEIPTRPYIIAGEETIPKYNLAGIKRQKASIHEAMRTLASNLNGDAIMDIAGDTDKIHVKVITYVNASSLNTHA